MSVTQKNMCLVPTDYDRLFYESGGQALPCDQQFTSKDQAREQLRTVFQNSAKDLSFIASCECGNLEGNYYEGVICPKCHTEVKTNFAEELKFRAWLEIPDFAPPLLHPAIYRTLHHWIGKHLFSLLLDVDAEIPLKHQRYLQGIGQGLTYFCQNFDDLVRFFLYDYKPLQMKSGKWRSEGIAEYIAKFRNRVFIRHFPILNQSLHLLTSSGTMSYGDNTVDAILNARAGLASLIYVKNSNRTMSNRFIDQRMWDIQKSIFNYSDLIAKEKLIGKSGLIRKGVLGIRMHCTYRAVIVPITEPHELDELHLPYLIGVTCWKLELINLMIHRYHLTMPQAIAKHKTATTRFDPEVYDLLNILIQECKAECHRRGLTYVKGLPTLFGRNPSMRLGAIFLLFVTKFKANYGDVTISISPTISSAPNFDFDGDAMHGVAIKELQLLPSLMNIHPSNVLIAGNSPGITSDVVLTKEAAMALSGYLNDPAQFDLTQPLETASVTE